MPDITNQSQIRGSKKEGNEQVDCMPLLSTVVNGFPGKFDMKFVSFPRSSRTHTDSVLELLELFLSLDQLLGQAHAHTNAACVLASLSFVVCPSSEGKWTIFSDTSLIVSCSQQCPTELPGDRCNNYGNSVQSSFKQYAIRWTRFRRINDLLSSSLRIP
jgi:hypothetical protein